MNIALRALIASAVVGATAAAQAPPPPAAVPAAAATKFKRLVQVYDADTQQPIADADVVDRITGNSVKTSLTGHFVLVPEFVKASGAYLRITKIGYAPLGPVLVDPMSDTIALIPMTKQPTTLDAVTTTAKFNLATDAGKWEGFEQRCAVGHVSCVKAGELAEHSSARISDMLVRASDGGVKRTCARSITLCNVTVGGCPPAYFIDGKPFTSLKKNGGVLPEIETFLGPAQIKGIEIYRPELVPLRFSSGCSAIVIWTK